MEINELVFYERLSDIQRRLSQEYFSLSTPRPADYDKEKFLEEYKEFAVAVHEETNKLKAVLDLVQPNSLESVLGLFLRLYGDELVEAINSKNRIFPSPPMYGHTVKKPDPKAGSTAVE